MKRHDWKFQYLAGAVYDAAVIKMNHHAERHAWWENQREETIKTIKEEGLTFDESLASSKMSNSYSRQPSITIDDKLRNDLMECNIKIQEHRGKYAQYSGWVKILGDQTKTMALELTHDDWLFFFRENTIDKPGENSEEFDE